MLFVASVLALGALDRSDGPLAQGAPSEVDGIELIIGEAEDGERLITPVGLVQTFTVPLSSASPICDDCQEWKLNAVDLMVSTTGTMDCYALSESLVVDILDASGNTMASSQVSFIVPMSTAGWITANFNPAPIVDNDHVYGARVRVTSSPPLPESSSSSTYASQSGHRHIRSVNNVAIDPALGQDPEACPDQPQWIPPMLDYYLHTDSNNPYPDGELDSDGSTDGMEKLYLTHVTTVNVLSVYYDPSIGFVNYADSMGSLTHTYAGRLHEIQPLWRDPELLAHQLASDIEAGAGGVVEIELREVLLDEWPPHAPAATISWTYPLSTTVLKTLTSWTKWTDDTYPGYPHIGQADPGRMRVDEGQGINGLTRFDYTGFFSTTLSELGQSPTELVNSGEIDEVWIFSDPTGGTHEAVMVKPDGDDSTLHIIGAPIIIADLERRVSVLGLNYATGSGNALHSFLHRTESMIARVIHDEPNGGIPRFCNEVSGSNGPFFRIFNCFPNADENQHFGSIGVVHRAFNSPLPILQSPRNLWDPDVVNFLEVEPTDEEEWYNFPNFSQDMPKPSKNCSEWGGCPQTGNPDGNRDAYYRWFLDHVPRYQGVRSGDFNNLWPYIFQMSCFPDL